jgi:hypothetical protein
MKDINDFYIRFKKGLKEKYGLEKKDIQSWTYLGWFRNHDGAATTNLLGERHFEAVKQRFPVELRGHSLKDFYELAETHCVCNVPIIENHLIVDLTKEDLEPIVIGSECIERFTKIQVKRTCSICTTPINNSVSGKCKECRKLRFCTTCNKKLKKGTRGTLCRLCNYYNLYPWLKTCNEEVTDDDE